MEGRGATQARLIPNEASADGLAIVVEEERAHHRVPMGEYPIELTADQWMHQVA